MAISKAQLNDIFKIVRVELVKKGHKVNTYFHTETKKSRLLVDDIDITHSIIPAPTTIIYDDTKFDTVYVFGMTREAKSPIMQKFIKNQFCGYEIKSGKNIYGYDIKKMANRISLYIKWIQKCHYQVDTLTVDYSFDQLKNYLSGPSKNYLSGPSFKINYEELSIYNDYIEVTARRNNRYAVSYAKEMSFEEMTTFVEKNL